MPPALARVGRPGGDRGPLRGVEAGGGDPHVGDGEQPLHVGQADAHLPGRLFEAALEAAVQAVGRELAQAVGDLSRDAMQPPA